MKAMPAILLAAALAPAAAPAAADPAMLQLLAEGRMFADRPLLRGYALCLLGGGDAAALGALMAEAGAGVEDDPEMGTTYYDLADAPFYIAVYEGDAICDVTSEEIGTDEAQAALMVVAGITGFAMVDGACPQLVLGGTVRAELTSSGNDPVCPPAKTSSLRFTFGEPGPWLPVE